MKLEDRSKHESAYQAVGRRVLARARLQLSEAVGGALSGGLEALGGRLSGASMLGQMGAAAHAHAHRLREVVERDRALVAAIPHQPELSVAPAPVESSAVEPAPAAPAAPLAPFVASAAVLAPPSPVHCDEPIRTRTMAKLLALQGHRQRALSIYDYLLAQDGGDQTLRTEAEQLRSAE